MKKASFFDIVAAMKYRSALLYSDESGQGLQCYIQSVSLEAGGGRTWNIRILNSIGTKEVFWSEDGIDKFFLL